MTENKDQKLSKNGYPMDEVVSALQKMIRRGMEFEAGFWALEIIDSGNWQYLMDRLQTIACEDIGLANPMAAVIVNAVRQGIESKLKTSRWKNFPKEQIGFLILYLCRSPKSRQGDDFVWYLQKKRKEGNRIEIPPVAVDEHTKRGREKVRQIAKEKGIAISKAQEEEFYKIGGLLAGGDNAEKIGGTNWSKILFEDMGLDYNGYLLNGSE